METGPLAMNSSNYLIPEISDSEAFANYAMGYDYDFEKEEYIEIDNWYLLNPMPGPESTMKTTANDMNKYLLMHLGNGEFNGTKVLNSSTIQLMHSQHFTMDSQLPGYCYCFYEYFRNGYRAIMHEGDILGFASLFFLLPDQNIGFFMSMNRMLEPGSTVMMESPEVNALRQKFTEQFLDRNEYLFHIFYPQDTSLLPQMFQSLSHGFHMMNRD